MRSVKHIAEDIAYSDLVANNGLRLELRDAIADALAAERDERQTVTVTKDNAKAELERRMSELTDLLAIFFDADVDPRAWQQLLTYAPKARIVTDDDQPMASLPERLRRAAPFMRRAALAGIVGQHADTCEEAAEEIERLRAVIARAASASLKWSTGVKSATEACAEMTSALMRAAKL